MDKLCLNDKEEYPDDEVLSRYLGKVKETWDSFNVFLNESYPLFSGQWRYYNDGKSWLLKVTKKKKTIFWVSVLNGTFKIAFYFGDKAEPAIMASDISEELKAQFKNGKKYGKIRGITLQMNNKNDVENVLALIETKLKVK